MDEIADALAALPLEIHFVGGPYCGCFLHPQSECIHDVHQEQNEGLIPPDDLPHNFFLAGPHQVVLQGRSGAALYRMESDRRWLFRMFLEPVNAGQST